MLVEDKNQTADEEEIEAEPVEIAEGFERIYNVESEKPLPLVEADYESYGMRPKWCHPDEMKPIPLKKNKMNVKRLKKDGIDIESYPWRQPTLPS